MWQYQFQREQPVMNGHHPHHQEYQVPPYISSGPSQQMQEVYEPYGPSVGPYNGVPVQQGYPQSLVYQPVNGGLPSKLPLNDERDNPEDPEEKAKQEKRREKNRQASARYRERKEQTLKFLEEETKRMEGEIAKLEVQLRKGLEELAHVKESKKIQIREDNGRVYSQM